MDVCFELQELNNSIVQIDDLTSYKEDRNDLPYNSFTIDDVKTLNVLIKIDVDKEKIILKSDSDTLKLSEDGWYRVIHLILPTFNWLQSVDEKFLKYFDNIYVYSNSDLYKYIDHKLERVTLEEILEINRNSKTTVNWSSQDIFNTYYLEECLKKSDSQYLYFCKKKDDECGNNENCRRNHIWHLLNIINYYIHCGNNLEALRLLNEINNCISLCRIESEDNCCEVPKSCKCNG